VVQFTQLTLFSPPATTGIKSPSKKEVASHRPARVKTKLELRYLAFDDDYFWELIRKDYASAWKYVARMTRML
jgi:hypothetical protein